jgi:hypothetical protein
VVEWDGLENRLPARSVRGFESLSLRKTKQSAPKGHFSFGSVPSELGNADKWKMTGALAPALVCFDAPLSAIAEGNPSLSAEKSKRFQVVEFEGVFRLKYSHKFNNAQLNYKC